MKHPSYKKALEVAAELAKIEKWATQNPMENSKAQDAVWLTIQTEVTRLEQEFLKFAEESGEAHLIETARGVVHEGEYGDQQTHEFWAEVADELNWKEK